MSQKVGIITSDPQVAALIYDRMVSSTAFADHADICLYSRPTGDADPYATIHEGTATLQKMGVDVVIFPEIDVAALDQITLTNTLPIAASSLAAPITGEDIAPLKAYLKELDTPVPPSQQLHYDALDVEIECWAQLCKDLASGHANGNYTTLEPSAQKTEDSPARPPHGLIAIQGGIGVEAGLESFTYVADNFNGAVLLDSSGTIPNETDYILELKEKGLESLVTKISPENRLRDLRQKIESLKPDAVFMACNTAHYFHDAITQDSTADTFHLIEEGLKAVPPMPDGSKRPVLVLATQASIDSGLYADTLKRSGREDIELVAPDAQMQELVNQAIWSDISFRKDNAAAAEKFSEVITRYQEEYSPHLVVMLGCTEVALAVDNAAPLVIDNAKAAADKAIAHTKSRHKDRKNDYKTISTTVTLGSITSVEGSKGKAECRGYGL